MNKMTQYLLLALLLPITGTQAAFFMGFEFNTPNEIQNQINDKKNAIEALAKTLAEMDIPEVDQACYRQRLSENDTNDLANKFIGNESLLHAKQAELKNLEKLLHDTQVKLVKMGACLAVPVVLAICGTGAFLVYKKQKNKNKKKDMVMDKLTKASEVA